MAQQTYDFLTPSEYTYDNTKIEVSSGLSQLKDLRPSDATLYASFGTDEDSDWADGSLNNTLVNGATWDNGKIDLTGITGKRLNMPAGGGNFDNLVNSGAKGCIRFTYIPDYNGAPTSGGHILELDASIGNNNAIFIRHYGPSPTYVSVDLRDSSGVNHWMYTSAKSFVQGQEYEFELNFDFTGVSRLFIDGVSAASLNTSSWTRTNTDGIFKWGGDSGSGDFWIKDIVLFNDVQHTSNYTPGISISNTIYDTSSPTIQPTSSFAPTELDGWLSFTEILGGSNSGTLAYQLSNDNGYTWLYWNGSNWITAVGTQYNDASTINANIGALSVSPPNNKLLFRAFLISNGNQKVELDEIEIDSMTGNPPFVNTGTDKDTLDGQAFKPFSDAVISDPNGDINNGTAWYDIEGSGDIEIPKGAFGTLQEAVRNFEYTFNNLGIVPCKLTAFDEVGSHTNDTMNTTVNKYNITFQVTNQTGGTQLENISFTAGDGSSIQISDSPITHEYAFGVYSAIFSKDGFITKSVSINANTDNQTIEVVLESTDILSQVIFNIDWQSSITKGDNITLPCKIDQEITNWKIRCEIYDSSGESVKVATANSGGSNDEIEITDNENGQFKIIIAKDLTTDFNNKAIIEIELENATGDIYTVYKSEFTFQTQQITWTDPTA